MEDYILDANQAGTIVNRDALTIRRWYGEKKFMDKYPNFYRKVPNPDRGQEDVYISASMLAKVARDKGILVNLEEVAKTATTHPDILEIFRTPTPTPQPVSQTTEQNNQKAEQPQGDRPNPTMQNESRADAKLLSILERTITVLEEQLREKDKQIASFQERSRENNIIVSRLLPSPQEPEVPKDQQTLPLDEKNTNFIIVPEQEREEEKPKRKIKVGIWPFRKTIEI